MDPREPLHSVHREHIRALAANEIVRAAINVDGKECIWAINVEGHAWLFGDYSFELRGRVIATEEAARPKAVWVPCDPAFIQKYGGCGRKIRQPELEMCNDKGGSPGPHFHVTNHNHLLLGGVPVEEV